MPIEKRIEELRERIHAVENTDDWEQAIPLDEELQKLLKQVR